MSLRARLNLLLSTVFVTTIALGAVLVIDNARRAVAEETDSTARLALRMLDVASTDAAADRRTLHERVSAELTAFEDAPHLQIALFENGREVPLAGESPARTAAAPRWFARLVEPAAAALHGTIAGIADEPATEIVVRPDPGDEIAEAWDDARPLLVLVLAVAVVANGVLYFTLGRWLHPVERIVGAMDDIAKGDYRARLPAFELPELASIAERFNRMAEVLERSREQNRALTERSLAIQEDERRALAHELHDELGQSISAIKAIAASIGEDPGGPRAAGAAATIGEIASHVYAVVRGMMRRLRPVLLDDFGLVRALEDLVDGWNERQPDAFCRLRVSGRIDDCGDAVEIGVYRAIQECLTNVTKHARASEVDVAIERRATPAGDRLRVIVSDDGVGYDPGAAPQGLGLLGMRERVEALKGTFETAAAPGRGAAIAIEVPLAPPGTKP